MKNSMVVVTIVILMISGFAFSKMMGIGGGCCSTHQTHNHK